MKMCQVVTIRYHGCEHPDHFPGELHEMPIYCANLEFVEAGTSTTDDVCLMCRITLERAGSGDAEQSGGLPTIVDEDEKEGKEEEEEEGKST